MAFIVTFNAFFTIAIFHEIGPLSLVQLEAIFLSSILIIVFPIDYVHCFLQWDGTLSDVRAETETAKVFCCGSLARATVHACKLTQRRACWSFLFIETVAIPLLWSHTNSLRPS